MSSNESVAQIDTRKAQSDTDSDTQGKHLVNLIVTSLSNSQLLYTRYDQYIQLDTNHRSVPLKLLSRSNTIPLE